MGRTFYSFEEFDVALDKAISDAMNSDNSRVQKNAKEELVNMAETFVYNLYPNPFYLSRRNGQGGILDEKSYTSKSSFATAAIPSTAKGFTTHIYAEAQWQQKFGGSASNNPDTLVEALEKNGIYNHEPVVSFMERAEANYGSEHRFGKDLVLELEDNGF